MERGNNGRQKRNIQARVSDKSRARTWKREEEGLQKGKKEVWNSLHDVLDALPLYHYTG